MARIRVGLAQIATLPAYATPTADFLREPAPPRYEVGKFPGYLSLIRGRSGLNALMTRISEVQREDLEEKLQLILAKAAEQKVHLLAFPEYTIPLASIPFLRSAAQSSKITIAAGSHVVTTTPDALAIYRNSGMIDIARAPAANVRKALCPVLHPDGSVSVHFKTVRSKWEDDLQLHEGPQAPIDVEVDGAKVQVELAICIEALKAGFVGHGGKLLLVLAMSRPAEEFDLVLKQSAFNEIPGVFVNDALHGGSTVKACASVLPAAFSGLLTAAPDEEVLTVVDLETDQQFGKQGSVNVTSPARLILRAPFLYEAVADHAELGDYIRQVKDGKVEVTPADLRGQLLREAVPKSLRAQFELAIGGLENGSLTAGETQVLVDGIVVPSERVPFINRCVQGLEEASRMVSELLSREPGDEKLLDSLGTMAGALKDLRKEALPLLYVPTPIDETRLESKIPFVNREEERRTLTDVIRRENVILLEGLAGIGKRRLAREVVNEVAPRSEVEEMFCVPGLTADAFLEEFEGVIGYELKDLSAMGGATRALVSSVVLVHGVEGLLDSRQGSASIRQMFADLDGTNIRVILTATKRPVGFEGFAFSLRRLKDNDLERILTHWCAAYGIEPPTEIVSHLYGHPSAAKFAAQAWREGRVRALDRLQFVKQVQKGIVEILLSELRLTEDEERALRALCVFRRPVAEAVLEGLPVADMANLADRLEDRFLVERFDGKVYVVPLVREYAESEWLRPGSYKELHEVAAAHYRRVYDTETGGTRFEAREEAIYHYAAAGQLDNARALGTNWVSEADAAIKDFYRRKEWQACAELCDKMLNAKGFSIETAARAAVAYARLARWGVARRILDQIKKLGEMPQWLAIAYAEALIGGGLSIEGVQMLHEICERDPNAAYARAALAEALLGRNQADAAEKYIDEALDLDPKSVRALLVASRLMANKGRLADAMAFATRAMEIDPLRAEKNYEKIKRQLARGDRREPEVN